MKISVGTPPAYQTPRYVTLNVPAPGPLAAFTASDGSPLTATQGGNPANAVTLNSDGSFTLAPNGGFTGFVVFTVTAHAGGVSSDPMTVIVTVGFANASLCGGCYPPRKVSYAVEAQISPVGFFPFLKPVPFKRYLTMHVHAELHKTNADGRTADGLYDGTVTVNPKNGSCQFTETANWITFAHVQPGDLTNTTKWTEGMAVYGDGGPDSFPGSGSYSGYGPYNETYCKCSWNTTDTTFHYTWEEADPPGGLGWSGTSTFVEILSDEMDYGSWLGLLKALLIAPPDPPWPETGADLFMYDSPHYANAGGGPPGSAQWNFGYGCSGYLDDSIVHNPYLQISVAVTYEGRAYVNTSDELIVGRCSKSLIYGCGCLSIQGTYGSECMSFPIKNSCAGTRQVISIQAPDFPDAAVDTDTIAVLYPGSNINLGALCINNECQDVTTSPDIGSSDPDDY